MIFHDVQQNTEEWNLLRSGRITSSKLGCVMANYGKAFGDPAKKYAVQIAVERLTGKPSEYGYSNDHMERGHQQEPIARMLYEQEMFCTVTNGGFFEVGDIGCSPDGLVGNDGLVEIKSVIPSVHFANIKRQSFDSAYRWQLVGNMKFTNRIWIDFVSYCATFPEDKRLYIYRLNASDYKEEFRMIDSRLKFFKKLISSVQNDILNKNYFVQKEQLG